MAILSGSQRAQQEQASRGYVWVLNGTFFGPNVRPPIRDYAITRQELPFHPGSMLRPSVPHIRPMVRDYVLLRQEMPWHPSSLLIPNPPPVPIRFAGFKHVMTRQEMPFHPRSYLFAGNQPKGYEDKYFFIIL